MIKSNKRIFPFLISLVVLLIFRFLPFSRECVSPVSNRVLDATLGVKEGMNLSSSMQTFTRKPVQRPVKYVTQSNPPSEEVSGYTQTNKVYFWKDNIDIVIPAAIPGRAGVSNVNDRTHNELKYVLRSYQMYAPWIHHIWILVNGNLQTPDWVPRSLAHKVTVFNRCLLLPTGTCPTKNSFAVDAYTYRLKNLTEHFIFGHDDICLGRPVTPDHFFQDGKPFIYHTTPEWGIFGGQKNHRMYEVPKNGFKGPTPTTGNPYPHYLVPAVKSFCASLHKQFPGWYNFLASHKDGRYSSITKRFNDKHNSIEEAFYGVVVSYLMKEKKGVEKIIKGKPEWYLEVIPVGGNPNQGHFDKAKKLKPIFMNFNDRFSMNPSKLKKELKLFHDNLEEMFPTQDTVYK